MALWVGARLDDEGCRVTVWGSREYLNRTATASVEVDSDDVREVRAALATILEKYSPNARRAAFRAAAKALDVALTKRETEGDESQVHHMQEDQPTRRVDVGGELAVASAPLDEIAPESRRRWWHRWIKEDE
jgi:hypothetical protein